MKNLIAYFVVLPVESSAALIAAALVLTIMAAIVIGMTCMPARAADTPPAERSTEKMLRDPTRPLSSTALRSGPAQQATPRPAVPVAMPQLQLVLTATERRFAVIDGELLGVGDSIREMTLLDIRDEAVIVKTPNGPRMLPLAVDAEIQGN